MKKPTLDEFVSHSVIGRSRRAYVTFPGFKVAYVRCTQRYINGELASPVLDLASIEATKPGNGAFTKMFKHIRKKYPEHWLYVESVLTPRFEKKLLELGFTQIDAVCPNFYLPPVKRKTS